MCSWEERKLDKVQEKEGRREKGKNTWQMGTGKEMREMYGEN